MGRAYEQLVEEEAKYRTSLVKIPTPEFYTFYNGKTEYPLEQELRLFDAFLTPAGSNSVELKVTAININSDKAHQILEKCPVLKEYSLFIDTVRKYGEDEGSLKKAINECIEKGILAEYLKRKGSEVRNMLIAEYSYEKDIEVKQQEARQEGIQEGQKAGRMDLLYDLVSQDLLSVKDAAVQAGMEERAFKEQMEQREQ